MADNSAFQNLEAEKAVLITFLKDGALAKKYVGELESSEFYSEDYKQIYAAIKAIVYGRGNPDIPTLADTMTRMYGTDVLVRTVILEMLQGRSIIATWNVAEYIKAIKNTAFRRKLYEVLNDARTSLHDPKNDTETVLDGTRQILRDLIVTGNDWKDMSDVLASTYGSIERKAKGTEPSMPSGISGLDKMTTGFHKGELTIIGARPSVGKSAFASHIALMAAQKGYNVGIISREMTDVQYGMRILSRSPDVDNQKMRTGNLDEHDWESITNAMMDYSMLPIRFMFKSRYIEDLRMEVQKQVDNKEHPLDLLIIDYLQLLDTKQRYDADWRKIAVVSKALKDMTVDFNIGIIALAQVGRSAQNSMPTLAELRGSGDIEQDADNVIFMHRVESGDDKNIRDDDRASIPIWQEQGKQYIVLNLAKQRQGETGQVAILFDPANMRYMGIARGV